MRTFEDVITEFQDFAWNGASVIYIYVFFFWKPKYSNGVPLMLVFVTGIRGRDLATQHMGTSAAVY